MAASNARYYTEAKAGRIFIGSTAAAGTAFPISTGTAVTVGLWNQSSNLNAVLLNLTLGYTSGTIALGTIGLANQYCGFAVGTAAPLTAWNGSAAAVKSAYPVGGQGAQSAMSFSPAASSTLTAGGTAWYWTGNSIESASAGTGIFNANIDLSGSGLILSPGYMCFVCGSVAQTGLFTMSLTWADTPINQ